MSAGADSGACRGVLSRREALLGAAACMGLWRQLAAATPLPAEVAGIRLPRSELAIQAVRFAERSCPPFLFNHCLRTFLFGALAMQRAGTAYEAEPAFVAAALHDLGLLPEFASKSGSFEIDGADRAVRLLREAGIGSAESDTVWHAIALHDTRFALVQHQGPEAMLVALGAGSDVLGPDPDRIDTRREAEILAAFPRLQFKREFTKLAIAHCRRKPLSQRGTWLEGLCREHSPAAFSSTLEQDIARAPFDE